MFTTLLRAEGGAPAADDDYWYEDRGTQTAAGKRVDWRQSMRLNAYLACVRVITDAMASLPLLLYRDRADGGKDLLRDHPDFETFNRQPNPWQTRFEFVEMMIGHVLIRGNAYAEITDVGLIPLDPDRMTIVQLQDFRLRYEYREQDGGMSKLSQDDVFHVRGMSLDGLAGFDPVQIGAETIAAAKANEEYAAAFWANDATPSGILRHPQKLSDKAFKNLQTSFASYNGMRSHRPRILEEGLEWQQLGINAEDAQVLESRKFGIEEICRMFRVPLHMVQSLDHATNNNIEHQGISFVTHTIRPWAVRFEQAADRDLIAEPDMFIQFQLDALQRGDRLTRYKGHQIGIASLFLSPNEARARENMNPREGGDEFENPNTTPGGGGFGGDDEKPDEADDDTDKPDKKENPFATVEPLAVTMAIDAAGDNLADRELRAIRKRLKSFDGSGQRIEEWLESYYGDAARVDQVVKILMAVSDAVDRNDDIDGTLDIDGAFTAWKLTGCKSNTAFEDWSAGRHEEIADIIRGNIK